MITFQVLSQTQQSPATEKVKKETFKVRQLCDAGTHSAVTSVVASVYIAMNNPDNARML